jgi:hypothetical protein
MIYDIQNDKKNCELIKRLSPVNWQYINLIGEYEFCHNQKFTDLQVIIEMLPANPKINYGG